MAFWNKAKKKYTAEPKKPEWLDWNVPQWVEHLSEGEQIRVMALSQSERIREYLDWKGKISLDYESPKVVFQPFIKDSKTISTLRYKIREFRPATQDEARKVKEIVSELSTGMASATKIYSIAESLERNREYCQELEDFFRLLHELTGA